MENAKTLLKEKGELDPETHTYSDRKYVKMAGNTLWNGVLLILDAVFHVKGACDKKLLSLVNDAYNILHLSMGYDGIQNKKVCDEGLNIANEIIDRCSKMLPMTPVA